MESGKERKAANHKLCELADEDLIQVTGGAVVAADSGSKQSWKQGDQILLTFKEQSQSVTLKREDEDTSEFVHQEAEELTRNTLNYQYYPPVYPLP